MHIDRRFTTQGCSPYDGIAFSSRQSEIRNPDGSLVFKQTDIKTPESWSQVAVDILAQKYFRKAGVPVALKKVREKGVPSFLWRSVPDTKAMEELTEEEIAQLLGIARGTVKSRKHRGLRKVRDDLRSVEEGGAHG